jgi:carboxypeptidase C (cathepsin A)
LLFLETPLNVGFSYSNKGVEVEYSDVKTAQWTLTALQTFLQLNPQYKNNAFWFAGESYAGMQIPVLAKSILDFNAGK